LLDARDIAVLAEGRREKSIFRRPKSLLQPGLSEPRHERF